MANEVYGILFSNSRPVSGDAYQNAPPDDEAFLRNVITPIYKVLQRVIIIWLHLHTFLCYLFKAF